MNYPDPDGEFPSIAIPVQAARKEYFHHVAIILPQSTDALVTDSSGDEERLRYVSGKTLNQDSGDEGGQDDAGISVKHADTRGERSIVEPFGRSFRILEEFSH